MRKHTKDFRLQFCPHASLLAQQPRPGWTQFAVCCHVNRQGMNFESFPRKVWSQNQLHPPPHTRGLQAVNPASVWAPRFNGQPLGLILCCCKPITSTSVSGAQIEASIFVTLQARLEIMFESVLTA